MHLAAKRVPCDQCHERRVKCKGHEPCEGCIRSDLQCTRLLVRRKRGPKTSTRSKKNITSFNHASDGVDLSPGVADDTVATPSKDAQPDSTTSQAFPRAFASLTRSYPMDMTVNELANSVLNTEGYRDFEPFAQWPDGVAGVQISASPHYSPSLVRPSVWLPRPSATPQDTQILETSCLNLNTNLTCNGLNNLLDGTALAAATGIPLRYATELIHCVEAYFRQTHHVLFVINEQSILAMLTYPSEMSVFQRSFFLSICAVTKLKKWCVGDFQDRLTKEVGCIFLERALQFRSSIDYMEEKSPMAVVASYLVHLSYACLNKPQSARLFMQEAICRALDIGLYSASEDRNLERIYAQRTLALLYVTERATVVLNDCNAILLREPPAIPSTSFDEEDRHCLDGFKCLFSLFALLDVEVVEYWCSGKLKFETQRNLLYTVLRKMQNQLSTISFDDVVLSDEQKADVLVTQEWLRLICWQISMRLGYLSSQAADPCFSYDYPINIASRICKVLEYIPDSALRAHHFSIVGLLPVSRFLLT